MYMTLLFGGDDLVRSHWTIAWSPLGVNTVDGLGVRFRTME